MLVVTSLNPLCNGIIYFLGLIPSGGCIRDAVQSVS